MEFYSFKKIIKSLQTSALKHLIAGIVVIFSLTQLSSLEAKKKPKVDICHYTQSTDTFKLLNISENAVDSHLNNHGDSLASDPGNGLDIDCTPMDALVFARAYRNVDGIAGYDPDGGDILYAEIVDASGNMELSVDDKVLVNVFPKDFSLSETALVAVNIAEHRIDNIYTNTPTQLSIESYVNDNIANTFTFFRSEGFVEYYDEYVFAGVTGASTTLTDALSTSSFFVDKISINIGSPSEPLEEINPQDPEYNGDAQWLEVEINLEGL